MSSLAPRQLQVLRLMAGGLTAPAIARHLDIAECSVKTHQQKLFVALGVHTGPHAVAVAYERGILPADPAVAAAVALLHASEQHGWRLALIPWEPA